MLSCLSPFAPFSTLFYAQRVMFDAIFFFFFMRFIAMQRSFDAYDTI